MIFTRVGCLLNGCCAGRLTTTWVGIRLPNHLGVWEKRVPTQCLEAGWAAILLSSAIVVRPWLPFPGALLLIVATGYAFGRLPLESMREAEPGGNRFTIDHAISTVVIVVSLAILAVRWPT